MCAAAKCASLMLVDEPLLMLGVLLFPEHADLHTRCLLVFQLLMLIYEVQVEERSEFLAHTSQHTFESLVMLVFLSKRDEVNIPCQCDAQAKQP